MMRKKLFIYTLITVFLLLVGGISLALNKAMVPQEIAIWDGGHNDYLISYFSSANGRWLKAENLQHRNQQHRAALQNLNPFKTASYEIAIGDHIGQFYCTADITQPAFGGKAKFIAHHGHCQTFVTPNGELALVVGKTS